MIYIRDFLFCQVVILLFSDCYGQPTIRFSDWMSTRYEQRTFRRLQKSLDYILLEMKRQTHENRQLKRQLAHLQNKVSHQDDLLFNLTESLVCRNYRTEEVDGEVNRRLEIDITMEKPIKDEVTVAEKEFTNVPQDKAEVRSTTEAPKTYFKDCYEIMKNGSIVNGTYQVKPEGSEKHFDVICEMHEGVAWNVIQRRQDGSVDFYRPWSDYKEGFGTLDGEFWIGNQNMHHLTSQARYMLKIDMWDWKLTFKTSANALDSNYFYAESSYFRVGNESEYFKLYVPESFFAYSGYSGSGLRVHSGPFMTYDVAIPRMRENCAVKFHCGWWFTTCVRNANLNGRYYSGGYEDKSTRTRAKDDIYWPNIPQSLKKVQMKIARIKKE